MTTKRREVDMADAIQKAREALVAAREWLESWASAEKQLAKIDAALAALDAETEVKVRGCATEGCGKPAIYHFIRGDVGSHYCRDCYMRVQALVPPESRSMSGLDEKIKPEELTTLFPDGVPMVAMKIIFPESSHPLTIAEVRCVLSALAASATPAYVGEEPVAWVNERAIDDIAKGNEQDGFAGVQTVLWADENTAGKRHSKRAPLYTATALERVTRERDEALKGRDDWKGMFEQAKQKHGYCIVRANELTDKLSAAEAKLAEARKVIEPFARAADNADRLAGHDGPLGQFVGLEHLRAARRFREETK